MPVDKEMSTRNGPRVKSRCQSQALGCSNGTAKRQKEDVGCKIDPQHPSTSSLAFSLRPHGQCPPVTGRELIVISQSRVLTVRAWALAASQHHKQTVTHERSPSYYIALHSFCHLPSSLCRCRLMLVYSPRVYVSGIPNGPRQVK